MKFNILGREVEVSWDHIWMIIVASLILIIGHMVIVTAYTLIFRDVETELTQQITVNTIALSWIFRYVNLPISAFILLSIAKYFKIEKNEAGCRSLAGSNFLVFGIGYTALIEIAYLTSMFGIEIGIEKLLGTMVFTPLNFALQSFLLYLWLGIMIKPDEEKLEKTAVHAVIFAVAAIILLPLINFILAYQEGSVYVYKDAINTLTDLSYSFIFAYPLLYHAYRRKIDLISYVFAAVYLLPSILILIFEYVFEPSMFDIGENAAAIIAMAAKLAIIYLLTKEKEK
jgi:hypothetical protein